MGRVFVEGSSPSAYSLEETRRARLAAAGFAPMM